MDIKTCPMCGSKIENVIVAMYPMVTTQEECTNCDWMGEYKEHPNAFKNNIKD